MSATASILYWTLLMALVSANHTASKQLSTVFVLETSDSQTPDAVNPSSEAAEITSASASTAAPTEPKARSLEDPQTNTRIITDDSPLVTNENKQPPSNTQHNSNNRDFKNQHQTSSQNSQRQRETSPSTSTRRPHEESHSATQIKPTNSGGSHTTTRSTKPKVAPSNNNRDRYESSTQSTPKTEERLLISITSGDDDEETPYNKPPNKQISVGNGGSIEIPVDGSTSQGVPHKRTPSITISIQDANLKQNDGPGSSSAVIVRPSQNGQSIVISTVGANGDSTNGGKHNGNAGSSTHNKPAISVLPSSVNEPPYREPVNVPISSQVATGNHHQIHPTSSSTYRPSIVSGNHEHSQANRPISTTLIDSQRPTHEERPQRPISPPTPEESYELSNPGGKFTSPRPVLVRPTQEPSYDQSDREESVSGDLRPINNPQSEQLPKYPLNEKNCGLQQETRIVGGDVANPDDFMWMAAIILSKPKEGEAKPFCGGSLITRRHILTAAHCLENLAPRDVLVRLGSYDFDDATASSLSADYAIDQFRVPAQYSKKTHVADIAILRLKTPLSTTDNYKTVCMPQARRSYVGAWAKVTGYGSQSQTFRRSTPKLRQVTVPIWENRKCSVVYKKNLTESFLCAGFEEGGKDACQGDSGGPLMTEGPNERMMVVGVVSHGIGCGSPGYPGVYTRTSTFLDWIEKNTKE